MNENDMTKPHYRLLNPNETIQAGDVRARLFSGCHTWQYEPVPCDWHGSFAEGHEPILRRIGQWVDCTPSSKTVEVPEELLREAAQELEELSNHIPGEPPTQAWKVWRKIMALLKEAQ